jgi:hypothetical protein
MKKQSELSSHGTRRKVREYLAATQAKNTQLAYRNDISAFPEKRRQDSGHSAMCRILSGGSCQYPVTRYTEPPSGGYQSCAY